MGLQGGSTQPASLSAAPAKWSGFRFVYAAAQHAGGVDVNMILTDTRELCMHWHKPRWPWCRAAHRGWLAGAARADI